MTMISIRKYLWLLLSCLCGAFLFVGGPGYDSLRSIRELWNVGHVICFSLWGYGYASWRQRSAVRVGAEVLLLSLSVGALTELIQSQVGRDPSVEDLWHDMLGGLLGFLLCSCWRYKFSAWNKGLVLVIVSIVGFGVFVPTLKAGVDDVIAWRQVPVIADFESPFEHLRWTGSAVHKVVQDHARSGDSALRVMFSTQRYSGVSLRSVHHDWHSYDLLRLQVFNPDVDEFVMYMRIEDKLHNNDYSDRYNSSFMVVSGWNVLEVPLVNVERAPKQRLLDLRQVANVGLFVGKLTKARVIYIDDVALISSEK